MSEIFISYAGEDRSQAEALAHTLQQEDWSVWWDRTILPGQTFDTAIEKALNSAKCVIVLWSRNSVVSDWVKDEAADAATRQILVPVLIEDIAIPLGFRRLQTANLSDWHGTSPHAELDHLLNAVSEKLGNPTTVTKRKPPMEATNGKPKSPAREGNQIAEDWRAELLSKSLHDRRLRVYLTHDKHVIDYQYNFWKDYVKVDGEIVSEGWGIDENYRFQISDGASRYDASVECKSTPISLKQFRLIISGRVLYGE